MIQWQLARPAWVLRALADCPRLSVATPKERTCAWCGAPIPFARLVRGGKYCNKRCKRSRLDHARRHPIQGK